MSKDHVSNILKPWVNQPAGLLFMSHAAMSSWQDYGKNESIDKKTWTEAATDMIRTVSYICAAKDCLTREVRIAIVDWSFGWSGQYLSKDKIERLVEEGSRMSDVDFDNHMKENRRLMGDRVNADVLYAALCCSGVDGLNAEEIIRFLRVGRSIGVSEEKLNHLLITYFHEASLIKAFETNIISTHEIKKAKDRQSKL